MKTIILIGVLLVFLFQGCKKEDVYVPKVGDIYQGGVVIYLDSTKRQGLVLAPQETETTSVWGCNGKLLNTTVDQTQKQYLAEMNYKITTQCNDVDCAARYCINLESGGYKDWLLPNVNEWFKIWKVPEVFTKANIKIITPYWSAYQADANRAAYVRSDQPGLGVFDSKSNKYLIRAVRYFDF